MRPARSRGGRLDVAFTHDLVRRACYGELPAGRRRAAHARLARMMSAHPGRPPAEVAHHLRGAGDDERARAVPGGRGRSAPARSAPSTRRRATSPRRRARPAAADSPAAEAEAWLALAEIEAWRGDQPADGRGLRARARALLTEVGDVRGLAAALAERSRWLRTTTCYPEEAFRSSREAIELLDASGVERARDPAARHGRDGVGRGGRRATRCARERMLADVRGAARRRGRRPARRARDGGRASRSCARGRARAPASAAARRPTIAEQAGRPALALDARIGEAACAAAQGLIPDVLEILARAPDPSRTGPGLACQSWAGVAHALSRLDRHEAAVEAAREEMRVAERFGSADLEAAASADLGADAARRRPGRPRPAASLEALPGRGGRPRAAGRPAAGGRRGGARRRRPRRRPGAPRPLPLRAGRARATTRPAWSRASTASPAWCCWRTGERDEGLAHLAAAAAAVGAPARRGPARGRRRGRSCCR